MMGAFESLLSGNDRQFIQDIASRTLEQIKNFKRSSDNKTLFEVASSITDPTATQLACFKTLVEKLFPVEVLRTYPEDTVAEDDPFLLVVKDANYHLLVILREQFAIHNFTLASMYRCHAAKKIKLSDNTPYKEEIKLLLSAIFPIVPLHDACRHNDQKNCMVPKENVDNYTTEYLIKLVESIGEKTTKSIESLEVSLAILQGYSDLAKTIMRYDLDDLKKALDKRIKEARAEYLGLLLDAIKSQSTPTLLEKLKLHFLKGTKKGDETYQVGICRYIHALKKNEFKEGLNDLLHQTCETNDLDTLRDLFPGKDYNSLNQFEVTTLSAAITNVGKAKDNSAQSLKSSMQLLDYLNTLATPSVASGIKQNADVAKLINDKKTALRELLLKTITHNMTESMKTTAAGWQDDFQELKSFYGVNDKTGKQSPAYEGFVAAADALELDEHGNRKVKAGAHEMDLKNVQQQIIDSVMDNTKSVALTKLGIQRLENFIKFHSKSNPQVNFISALKNLAVMPSNKPIYLLVIDLPGNSINDEKRAEVVSLFHHHLGAEITDGEPATDPLVLAAKCGKVNIVNKLLPYYVEPKHWNAEKYIKLKECLKKAIDQAARDCEKDPACYLSVFKALSSESLCQLKLEDSGEGTFGQIIARYSASIELKLKAKVRSALVEEKATPESFQQALKHLKLYHESIAKSPEGTQNLFAHSLAQINVAQEADPIPLSMYIAQHDVNINKREAVLNELISSDLYATSLQRQGLYDVALPRAQRAMRKICTKYSIVASPDALPLGLTLSTKDLLLYIGELFRSHSTSPDHFNRACEVLKSQLQLEKPAENADDLLSKELLTTKFAKNGVEQTLLQYACAHGTYSEKTEKDPGNPNGMNAAVLLTFLKKHKDDDAQGALALIEMKNRHSSVSIWLSPYSKEMLVDKEKQERSPYKSAAITGAKCMAVFATLAIVGVLMETYLFGGDDNMQDKLRSLANWCWKDSLGQHSNVNDAHEAEMLTCVGALMVVGAGIVGAGGGAVAQKMRSSVH